MDRADGCERFRIGHGERAEADGFRVRGGGFDLAVGKAERGEVADDAGLGLALGGVGAGDDEVQGVAVKCLAVDGGW